MSRHRRASHSNPIWRLVSALVGVVALVAAMAVTGSVASADTPASADGWTVTASVGLPIDGASSGDTPAALTTLAPGSTVDPGQALTYSLRVVNQTAVATAQPVTVVDQIDDLLASAAIATSADDLAKAGIIVDEKAGTLSWTPSPIAGGQYAETSFEVIVDKDAAAGTLTTAAAVDGATCKAGSPCATSLTVSGASSPDSDGNAMSSGPGDDASTSTAAPTTTSPAPTTSSSTSRGTGAGHSSRMGVNSLAGGVHPMDSSSASIVVHAGGVRTGDGTVSSLAGVKFQAERNGSVLGTCTTDSGGDCTISGADTDTTYDISQVGAPDGWYANPKLDRGDASTGHAADYVFRVRTGGSGSTVDVPGRNPDSSYSERGGSSNDSDGNPFLGLWATSRDDNPMPNVCGLNIALVMDESGSMGDKPSGSSDTKLSLLKTAAKGVVDALIPSTSTKIALYSFAQGTDKMSGLSHDASDLKSKINTLRASGGTNWDQGLYQVVKKRGSDVYDLVVVLTDGNPTQDHNGNGDNNRTRFDNVSNAIFSANAIKNMPNTQGGKTRLVAIGIGVNGGDENIRAISGTQLNSDYFLSSGSNFGDALKSTLLANCGLTVTKKVQDENGVQTPAQGWTITANTGTGNDNETTDSNGNAVFGPLPSGSVTFTITENQKSSYHVVPASGKNMTCVQGTHTLAVTNVGTDESGGKPGVTFTADPSDGGIHCTIVNSNVVANPPLPPKCGLNIALVLDLSGSISDHDFGTEKDAAIGVVKALKGTPSNVGLYTFASTAPAAGGPGGNSNVTGTDGDGVSVATDAGVTELVSAINGLDKPTFFEGYYTNWGQGLLQVESSHKYDAILFVTDGNPTTYGNGSDVSDFGKALNKGIAASEVIKGHGTRIIAVGVDSDGVGGGGGVSGLNADNLKAISGPTEYDGTNASTADWFTVDDWSKLGDALKSIATDTCKGTLTVVKELQTWDGQADGAGVGWTFSTSTDGVETQDGHQSSGETGSDGTLNFTVDYGDSDTSKDVHIAETQQDGYKLVQQDGFNATCTSDNEALGVTNDGDLGFSVEVKNDEVVTCTVINRAPAPIPHLTLVKKVQNYDTGGTAKPADWTLQASGAPDGFSGAGNSAAVTDQPVTQGATYTLSESGGPGGYSASQWACAGAATWSRADGTVTPAAGEDITCTITNTAIAPHLTLKKWAVDLDGNGAFSDQWTLTATDDASGDTPIAGTPTDADAGIGADVTAGVTYDLYESDGPTGYTPGDAWVCDGGKFASPDQIELGVGENVTCTMTNTKQFQPLTITKTVTASYDRTYEWNITKAVNKKEATVSGDEKATFHYTVTATPDGVTDHDWAMAGTITVGNPNDVDVTATVTDVPSVGGGATCAVADGVDATIPANGSKEFHYSCTIPSRPQYTGGTNTATVTWTRNSGGHVDTNPAVDVTFGLGNETNKTVHVTDDKTTGSQKPLGKATWTDGAATFQYDVEKQGTTGECVKYDNTAEISETGQLAKQSVQVCEPVATVAKSVTVTRAPGGPVGGDTLPVQPGDHLTWTITVHNPGSIPLTGQLFLDVIEDNVLNGTTFDPTVSGAFTVSPAGASVDVTYDTSNHTVTATTTGNGLGGSDTVEISYSGSVLGQDVLNAKGITTIDNTVIPTAPLTCAGDCSTHNPLTPTATVSKSVTSGDVDWDGKAVVPGQELTWTITVTNTSSVPYSGVVFTDDLTSTMAGTDLDTSDVASWSSNPGKVAVSFTAPSTLKGTATNVAANSSVKVVYTAHVKSQAALNSGGVTSIDNMLVLPKGGPTCDQDCDTHNPLTPKVEISKSVTDAEGNSVDGDRVDAGQSLTWAITVRNTSSVPYSGALFTDDLTSTLAGTDLDTSDVASWSSNPGQVAVSFSDPDLSATANGLAANSTVTVSYTATVKDQAALIAGKVTHIANVVTPSGSTPTCVSDAACSTDNPLSPHATVSKSVSVMRNGNPAGADGSLVRPDDVLTWTITVRNTSSVPFTGDLFSDDLSSTVAGTDFDPAAAGAFDVSDASVSVSYADPKLTGTATALPANTSVTITYSGVVRSQDYLNDHQITSIDNLLVLPKGGPTCDQDCDTHNPLTPKVEISKAVTVMRDGQDVGGSGTEVQPGDTLIWVITATNASSVPFTDDTLLTDNVGQALDGTDLAPAAESFVSSNTGWMTASYSAATTTATGTATASGLPPDESVTLTYSGRVLDQGALNDGKVTRIDNLVVPGTGVNCVPGQDQNNPCSTHNPVGPAAEVSKAVTVTRDGQDIGGSGTAVQPGDKLTWVLSVHNTGSVPYSGSALTDNLSSAIAGTDLSSSTVFTSSSPAQLSADTSGWPTLDVTATLLPPEHTETITYSAIVDSRADLSSAGITTIDNTIVAGDVPTCQSDCGTTNPVAPRLTLVKDVVNGSTGPATSPDWTLSATDSSGSAVIDAPGETNSTGPGAAVTAGTQYTLAEQPTYAGSDVTNGYTPSTWSCVNGNGQARYTLDGADISLGDGADVTCTITNTWHPVATTVKSVASTVQQADGSWTITYELSVTNPDTVLPATYTLTDTPGFGSGINITGATITDPAGGTGPAWDGAGTVVLAADRGLAAGANETWTVAIDAVVTAKATSTDLDCSTDHTPGSGFFNSATITSGPGGNDSTACSEPATPDVTKTFDGPATQNLDGDGNWDGSWTIPFTITVTNNSTDPSEPVLTYSLSDEPDFPGDVTVLGMTVTDSSVAGVVPGSYDGTTGVLTIVPADAAVPLAPGATDTFSIDVVAVVPAADDFGQDTCAQGSDASNLTNLATAHSGQSDYTAQDCGFLPPLPVPSVTKSVVSTVQQADGSWTVTYRVVVTNGSDSLATQYDVTDTLAYGAGISVNEASASGPGVNTSWDGVSDTDLAVGQFLSAGASAQYTVTVNADVASSTGTGPKPATQCQPGGPGEPGQPGGFGNNSHVGLAGAGVQQPQPEPLRGAAGALTEPDVRSGSQDAYACSEPATPDVTKTFVSAMQHAGADGKWDGTWDVTYTVTVSNPSADAALSYDLSDSPEFPADVTVNGGSVTGTASDGSAIDVKDGWNGTSATAIVTGRPLAAGDTDSYTVVVNATVPASITTDEATCSTDTGAGHGFFNTAAAVSGADTVTAEDCGDIPALPTPNVAKSVSSVTQNADGTWTVVYDLVVTNPSVDKSGTYDLDDTIAFGAGITVQSATVTGPDDATLNPSWTGADPNTSIVSGRIIGPHTQESYTVTVVAGVGSTSTATDRDCTLDSGESGTGFLNTATLAVGDHTSTSSACASPVSPTITKQVASVTAVGNGVSIVAYDVVVSNPSASTGLIYDLADTLGFPADVTVSDPHASWVRSALDGSGATASQDVPGWTGAGDGTTLATGQSLPAGSMDTYHVVVTATVPFSVPADQLDCLTPGGAGHGFFNEGAVTSGSDTLTASACADIPPTIEVLPTSSSIPPSTSSVPPSSTTTIPVSPTSSTIAYTGVNTLGMGWLAFLLLGAGALLLAAGAAWRRKPRRH